MHVQQFEGINTVDPALWNRVTSGYPYAGWQWCLYGERAQGLPGHFLIAFEGDEPVGGAILWVMHEETIPVPNPLARRFLSTYLRWRPVIMCKTPVLTDHNALFLPADPGCRAQALDKIKQACIEILHQQKGSFLLFDYLVAEQMDYEWGSFSKMKDFLSIGTRMDVTWDTFDEYLAALKEKNKKACKNVLHNMRYAQEEGIVLRVQHEAPPTDEVMHLMDIKRKHYKVPINIAWIRRILGALPTLPEQNAMWVLAYRDDRMVGCEVLLYDDQNRVCKPALYGRDYSAEFVYFPMCYEDIRYAIETFRAKTIIYDTEAYDFKRRIGFGADPRNNLVFCPNSKLERTLVRLMNRFISD